MGMTTVSCGYGQIVMSCRTLGARWGWSEAKVRRFLKLLANLHQVVSKSVGVSTQITICNYSTYDPKRRNNDATATQTRRTGDAQVTTKKNEKNDKNEETLSGSPLGRAITDFAEHRKKLRKPATKRALELARAKALKLGGGDEARAVAIVENAIESGWQGIYPIPEPRRQADRRELGSGINQTLEEALRDG